jgi:hypothetical protein
VGANYWKRRSQVAAKIRETTLIGCTFRTDPPRPDIVKGALLEGQKPLSSAVFIVLSPQNLSNRKTRTQC